MNAKTSAKLHAIAAPLISETEHILSEEGEKDIQTAKKLASELKDQGLNRGEVIEQLEEKLQSVHGLSELRASMVTALALDL